ncbi:MAG: RNA polymerase sigma factor [Elusimicrobia bacterium]|nr:RNA polymerase sigma factor [Elusimicrobiota bacterium]
MLSFEELFAQQKQALFGLIYKALGNREQAEDLVMQVFLKAYKGYSQFQRNSAASSWLYRIAINTLRDHLRWKSRQKRWGEFFTGAEDSLEATVADPMPCSGELLEQEELRERVRRAVQGLPDIYREVVWLVSFQDLSYEDAASALEISVESIGVRLNRAKGLLRKSLETEL